jgi:AhpD family alkylhydroperoxidase
LIFIGASHYTGIRGGRATETLGEPLGRIEKQGGVMGERVEQFNRFRREMNERILREDNLVVKRFFNLDEAAYRDGALDRRTKEMLGLVASMVLRCDDCIAYHIQRCHELGLSRAAFFEVFSVALVVGGSIVVPHLRRAVAFLDELLEEDRKE